MTERVLLCVDDEVHILNSLRRLLRHEGYVLLTASGGREGLTLLEKQTAQVVLSDHRMPEMTGIEFLQAVKELYPETMRVVLSGYAEADTIVDAINKGEVYRFLTKPWDDEQLKTSIRQCFEEYEKARHKAEAGRQGGWPAEAPAPSSGISGAALPADAGPSGLSQMILERLPLPVIGIDRAGLLVTVNQTARDLFESLRRAAPGTHVSRVLPADLAKAVSLALDGKATALELPPAMWHGRRVRIRIQPLDEGKDITGCILIPEPLNENAPPHGAPHDHLEHSLQEEAT